MKYFLTLLFVFVAVAVIGQNNYADGFTAGYKAGYCYGNPTCVSPPHYIPSPSVGESSNSYRDGYNRGFSIGLGDKPSSYQEKSQLQQGNYNPYGGVLTTPTYDINTLLYLSSRKRAVQEPNRNNKKRVELDWLKWNEGYSLAKDNKKIALIYFYTGWNGWCKRMEEDVFSDEDVANLILQDFIPIKLNPEDEEIYKVDNLAVNGSQLLGMLTNKENTGYPTIVFIYPNRNIEFYPGYQDAANFLKTLRKTIKSSNNAR